MLGIYSLGAGLILLGVLIDLLTLREWWRTVRAGHNFSMIPLVTLVFSCPGGIILLIAWRAFTGTNILLMVGALVVVNLMLQMGLPMIIWALVQKNRQ